MDAKLKASNARIVRWEGRQLASTPVFVQEHIIVRAAAPSKKRVMSIGLLVLVLLSCAQLTSAAKNQKTDVPAQKTDLRGTVSEPLVVAGELHREPPPPLTPEQLKALQIKEADDHSLSMATIWLAALTGLLVIVAVFQLVLFLRQLKLTEYAARDAQVAANAAKASADLLPKIERAYVFAKVSVFAPVRVDGQAIYLVNASTSFTNHGKTPAIVKRLRAFAVWGGTPPESLDAHEKADRSTPEGLVIGAGDSFDHSVAITLSQAEYNDLYDVIRRLYFVGLLEYSDILGSMHETGFCWHTYPTHDELSTSISPSGLNYAI